MRKIVGAMVGVGALMIAGSLAYAQGPGFGWGPGHGRGPGWGPGRGMAASLTAEERAEVSKMRQEHWTEMSEVRSKISAKRKELLAARKAGDQAKVDAITKDLEGLYAEQAQKRAAFRAEVAELTGKDVPFGPGFGPGMGRGSGPMMGRGFGHGLGRGMGMGYGGGAGCPMWQ